MMGSYQNESTKSTLLEQASVSSLRISVQQAISRGSNAEENWDAVESYILETSKSNNAHQIVDEINEDKALLFITMIKSQAPFKLLQHVMHLCGDKAKDICSTQNESTQSYLFHEACKVHNDPKVVKMLFRIYPDAINLEDGSGMTPMNIVYERDCDEGGAAVFFTVMKLFLDNVPKEDKLDAMYLFDREHYLIMIKFACEIDRANGDLLSIAKDCFKTFLFHQSKMVSYFYLHLVKELGPSLKIKSFTTFLSKAYTTNQRKRSHASTETFRRHYSNFCVG